MKFGLSDKDYQILHDLLVVPLKKIGCKIWVFGSRARGDHRPYSDLDVLFESESTVPGSLLFHIKSSLEESNLTVKVDLVNILELAESYKESIFKDRILI